MAVRGFSLLLVTFKTYLWIFAISEVAALPQSGPEPTHSLTENNRDINFYIYPTPESINDPFMNDPNVLLKSQPMTMVFHGFRGDHSARSMHSIKEALVLSGVPNVVVVDWSVLADYDDKSALTAYNHVRDKGVPEASTLAARWIQEALDTRDIQPADLHLVGFSLGAHVVGIVGHQLNSSVGRITGLDPPRFGYEIMGKDLRLDREDGKFVNCIHTSGGILSYTEIEPIGHVDFFPNGDTVPQNGCPSDNPIDSITCSHYMAFALFAESVFHKNALIATECDSWRSFKAGHCDNNLHAPMGYSTPDTTRGKFFMKTKNHPPYGEEDPQNPLPASMKDLLTYDKSEAFIQPEDVVNFLTHQGTNERAAGSEEDDNSGVMKVKGGSKTTTTPDPPSFLNNAASSFFSEALGVIAASLLGYNLFDLLSAWWNS